MKNFKNYQFTILLLISSIVVNTVHAQVRISTADFKLLNNTSWEGTLTYLDYQSNELVPIATTMQIKITDKSIEQNIQYTWEPNKNVQAKAKIRKRGKFLGKQKLISKTTIDGATQLITSAEGKDDNKKATFFFTYEFNENHYKVTKEVQFQGSEERFLRNKYEYKKI